MKGALRTRLEAPNDSSGSAVIVLGGTGVMRVHVVALKTPGKILEEEPIVEAPAYINDHRVVDEGISGTHVPNARHGVHEGPDSSNTCGDTGASNNVILPQAIGAIKATPVDYQA